MCWLCVSGWTLEEKLMSFPLPGNKILWETHPTSRAVDIERTPVEHFWKASSHVHLWRSVWWNQDFNEEKKKTQKIEPWEWEEGHYWLLLEGKWRASVNLFAPWVQGFRYSGVLNRIYLVFIHIIPLKTAPHNALRHTFAWEEQWEKHVHFHDSGSLGIHEPENLSITNVMKQYFHIREMVQKGKCSG